MTAGAASGAKKTQPRNFRLPSSFWAVIPFVHFEKSPRERGGLEDRRSRLLMRMVMLHGFLDWIRPCERGLKSGLPYLALVCDNLPTSSLGMKSIFYLQGVPIDAILILLLVRSENPFPIGPYGPSSHPIASLRQ